MSRAYMFPPQLLWEPYKAGATFPEGYAFAGKPVVSEKLSDILTKIDRVDFTGVLDPIPPSNPPAPQSEITCGFGAAG